MFYTPAPCSHLAKHTLLSLPSHHVHSTHQARQTTPSPTGNARISTHYYSSSHSCTVYLLCDPIGLGTRTEHAALTLAGGGHRALFRVSRPAFQLQRFEAYTSCSVKSRVGDELMATRILYIFHVFADQCSTCTVTAIVNSKGSCRFLLYCI